MSKFEFQRFLILFWGHYFSKANILSVNDNGIERKTTKLVTEEGNAERDYLTGLELYSEKRFEEGVTALIEETSLAKSRNCYFFTPHKKLIPKIKETIERLSLGNYDLFGIDPDYFYSFVPLNGKNHKAIEKYIVGMKTESSVKGKLKKEFKRLLIALGLSETIYEGFIFSVSGRESIDEK